jgi:hypothetical protein
MDGECDPQRVLLSLIELRSLGALRAARSKTFLRRKCLSEPDLGWIVIHWFELSTLALLCLNLWFVSAVLSTLRETNRWLSFLSTYQWEQAQNSAPPKR